MKKISILLITTALAALAAFFVTKTLNAMGMDGAKDEFDYLVSNEPRKTKTESEPMGNFIVYINDEKDKSFATLEEAVAYASSEKSAVVREVGKRGIIWDNTPLYVVYDANNSETEYFSFRDAYSFASTQSEAFIYYKKNMSLAWVKTVSHEPKTSAKIENTKPLLQNPELPRGCEVTSLCMLINYGGLEATKEELAAKIQKVPFSYAKNGKTFSGDPNSGFVGDMFMLKENGLGVYHEPIYNLLTEYFPDSALDITGSDFSVIKYFLTKNMPVWIITNTAYKKLPETEFESWETENGIINVTYKEHSVLVTGYDDNFVYFNDPLGNKSHADIIDFVSAWEQMGKQAITLSI